MSPLNSLTVIDKCAATNAEKRKRSRPTGGGKHATLQECVAPLGIHLN